MTEGRPYPKCPACDGVRESNKKLRAEVERLKAFEGNYRRLKAFISEPLDNTDQILADAEAGRRLPLTADGVRVVPGMDEVAHPRRPDEWLCMCRATGADGVRRWVAYDDDANLYPMSECCSTLEAMRDAQQQQQDESEVDDEQQ